MNSAYDSAQSAWAGVPTAFSPPSRQPAAGPAPAPSADAAGAEPLPTDKWGMIEFFAGRAVKAAAIEHEMLLVFDRRHSLARRLADAAKRRDEEMARDSTSQWLESEMKLAALFEQYEPVVIERKQVLQNIAAVSR